MNHPIGKIARAFENILRNRLENAGDPTEEDKAALEVYEFFDRKYQERPDYRLWRIGIRPYFAYGRLSPFYPYPTRYSSEWGRWKDAADACLQSGDDLILWSSAALAPAIISAQWNLDTAAQQWSESIKAWLLSHPSLLDDCPRSCGMTAFQFLGMQQYLRSRGGVQIDKRSCTELIAELKYWLEIVDPTRLFGEKIDTQGLEVEHNGQFRLRPSHAVDEFIQLVNSLRVLRPLIGSTIREAASELDQTAEALFWSAYDFALMAWKTARSRRLQEVEYQEALKRETLKRRKTFNESKSQKARRQAFEIEWKCALDLGNAARDAGDYLGSAKWAHLALRLIPDEFVADPVVTDELKDGKRSIIFRYIKEAGLRPDLRFPEPPRLSRATRYAIDGASPPSDEALDAVRGNATLNGTSEAIRAAPLFGWALRVKQHQRTDPSWQPVMAWSPCGPTETPAGYLQGVIKAAADINPPIPIPSDALSSIFELALHYGLVRSAAKILERAVRRDEWPLSHDKVNRFARHVRTCMTLDPFGMRHEKVDEWRKLIRDACAKLFLEQDLDSYRFKDRELWHIHETLNGRAQVHHGRLTRNNAKRLLLNSVDTVHEVDDLRAFYEREYDFSGRASNVADATRVAGVLLERRNSSLRAPVAISVLLMGQTVSVLGVGANGIVHAVERTIENLPAQVERFRRGATFWFKTKGNPRLNWTGGFVEIANAVLDVTGACDPEARVILLSPDATLAPLPWQHLFLTRSRARSQTAPGGGCDPDRDPIVAIISGLSGMTNRKFHPPPEHPFTLILSQEDDQTIIDVSATVHRTMTALSPVNGTDVCVVVGHGTPHGGMGGPGIQVRLGGTILETASDWIDHLQHKHVVLHCCHGGTTRALYMDEMGGLPGMALNLGAETVLAPVAQVSKSAAIALQETLLAEGVPTEIGSRYLHAIAKNPEVALYNLYGDPYGALIARPSSNVPGTEYRGSPEASSASEVTAAC